MPLSVCVWIVWDFFFFLRKKENVDLLSIIPQEQAALEGMVQQKQGHCGW